MNTTNWLIALTVGLVGFMMFVLVQLSRMQDEIYIAAGLGIINLYYNTIALENQNLTINEDGRVLNGDTEIKPKQKFSNVNLSSLNKESVNKILNNLNLKK